MGLRINTNQIAVNAQRNLRNNQAVLQGSSEKLASGSRINKSADDAAGLAISDNLGGMVRSYQQAGRNAQDGISFVQVAEGGMGEIGNMLNRLRELSVQASSDTIGNREREFLDREAQQLKLEMERVAQSTEFNGTKLLSGQGTKLDFQIGVNNDDFLDRISYDPSQTNVSVDALGMSGINLSDKAAAQSGLANIDNAILVLNSNRATLGALQNRLTSTYASTEIAVENFSAAKSVLGNRDFASVTADMTRDMVKTQASTAVLSQANQSTQMALRLLG